MSSTATAGTGSTPEALESSAVGSVSNGAVESAGPDEENDETRDVLEAGSEVRSGLTGGQDVVPDSSAVQAGPAVNPGGIRAVKGGNAPVKLEPAEEDVVRVIRDENILRVLPGPFEWCEIPARAGYDRVKRMGPVDIEAFQMGRYPVTNAQYEVFVTAADGYQQDRWWTDLGQRMDAPQKSRFEGDDLPRTNVTWYEAVAFCRWLSHRVGYTVRLPAEWEWQWTAEGSAERVYPWGDAFDAGKCNCEESRIGQTTPVDKYSQGASPFGVLDMAGNVWEWCLNTYHKPFRTDIIGAEERCVRGGSWLDTSLYLRSTFRDRYLTHSSGNADGFRCTRWL